MRNKFPDKRENINSEEDYAVEKTWTVKKAM